MDEIRVVGAREHNLKGIDLTLPRDSLVVITGLSGSGKSSLAFDTLYQEGQRRFVESLSSYARQFLGQMEKPRVDKVEGLSPTLCIDQKTVNRNPRSTVGTITEILDHLRLLMSRLGTARCPECKKPITTLSPGQIADVLLRESPGAAVSVLGPIVRDRKGEYRKELAEALKDGYLRARIDGDLRELDGQITLARYEKHTIELVVDRLKAVPERRDRLVEAIERGLKLGEGVVAVLVDDVHRAFSSSRSCPDHGISIPEMEPRLFSFNAPQGACPGCDGLGYLDNFDMALLFDDAALVPEALRALPDEESMPFSTLSREVLRTICKALKIPPKTRWGKLTGDQREALLRGADITYKVVRVREGRTAESTKTWSGIMPVLDELWKYTRLPRLAAARRQQSCPQCHGLRLNPIALAVDFHGHNISQLTKMNVTDARAFFDPLTLTGAAAEVGAPILREIRTRLGFLDEVGLGYLSIDRSAVTLSGGEAQRIRLASQVGAGLQGVTYVLDEPSIGLHARDQSRLLSALLALRDRGNTVLVVEHDPETMARADWLVEIGPGAGRDGGHVVASGPPKKFLKSNAITARYLRGEERIPIPAKRRPGNGQKITIVGATANNLRDVTVSVPLGCFVAVTGVSGSGKSSLILETLHKALAMACNGATDPPGPHQRVEGVENIDKVIEIDQAPIGRTPRSNPGTYTGAFDPIRDLFASLPESRARGYKKGRFSFNVTGGRCEECQGAGVKTVEMQFLADVEVPCESCGGRRFNHETLEIRYRGRSITDILDMTISEGVEFFKNHRKIHRVLSTLDRVGLGYVSLGQPSTTLSGGEAQRVKLATELQRPATGRTLYILDEPTTGLHMHDIRRLLDSLTALVEAGNTVLVIEHNTDVIKVADHLIDMGPEGGAGGGRLIGQGTPEQLSELDTPTGIVLAELFARECRVNLPGVADSAPTWKAAPTRRRKPGAGELKLAGVYTHNLTGVDAVIPHGKMTVITGPSGSGKTSLAFDTIFSEGQRRYVESLSTYARRFLGRMERAPVDKIEGLAPAIAIDQQNRGHNPRSTVATVTEIYDAFRLLYARIGHASCPACARALRADSPGAAARHLVALDPGAGWLVAELPAGSVAGELMRDGYTRVLEKVAGAEIERDLADPKEILGAVALVIDRVNPARTSLERLSEAIASAYGFGQDHARFVPRSGPTLVFTRAAICAEHGRLLPEEITPRHFSFNSHIGACAACLGLGRRSAVDPDLLLPDLKLPLAEALDPRVSAVILRAPRTRALVDAVFARHGARPDQPARLWSKRLRGALLYGEPTPLQIRWSRSWGSSITHIDEIKEWTGLIPIVEGWSGSTAWLRREITCPDCGGARLRKELQSVTLGAPVGAPPTDDIPAGTGISAAAAMTVIEARAFWSSLPLNVEESAIAEQALAELNAKLGFLEDVGLGYLTLDRAADTLSGGESQRIRLATQLGARLTGVLYVLDEPTIGLHQRDTARLLRTLLELRDLGNTLVVVEHDPDVIRAADHVLDLGPGAGEHGGRLIASGTPDQVAALPCPTGDFLSGRRKIAAPTKRRKPTDWIRPPKSSLHNLKDIAPPIPMGCLSVVTGVSGSGKSTYVLDVLAPWLAAQKETPRLVIVDQKPIGRTPRSTPASYCEILDPLRTLFSETALSRERGYAPNRFSYNHTDGGRCVHCEGRGAVKVEMHFLSDIWIRCDHCHGRRFDTATLDIRWKGHSIADVLDLSVDDALELFGTQRKIKSRLTALHQVGLGYLRLGQPAPTLSGGEAQRLKLANELVSRAKTTCYLLDEPTTGLHLSDVEKLIPVLHALVDAGHLVVVIEHHLDIIRNADHVIDLGPEGGLGGGELIFTGTPEKLAAHPSSHTGAALRAHAASYAAAAANGKQRTQESLSATAR